MKNKQKLFLTAFVSAVLLSTTSIFAKTEKYSFDVFLWGIKVGELIYSIKKSESNYDISGVLMSKGLARMVTKYKFQAEAKGKLSNKLYIPTSYRGKSDTKRRKEEKSMVYHKMVPKVTSTKVPQSHWAKPKSQKGTVDPMTAIHLVMSDKDKKTICSQTFHLFDGARRIEIKLSKIKIQENSAKCQGEYIREDGYSDEEMKEGKVFPFTVNYIMKGELYSVESLEIKALRGRTKFTKR